MPQSLSLLTARMVARLYGWRAVESWFGRKKLELLIRLSQRRRRAHASFPWTRPPDWVDARKLWLAYMKIGWLGWWRVGMSVISYVLIAFVITLMLGMPHVPARGRIARIADFWVLAVSVFFLVVLIFYVVDVVRQCAWFVSTLSASRTYWPHPLQKRVTTERQMDPQDLDDVLDITVIARRTQVVGSLVYYPFIIICLMIVARNRFFDDWDWPPGLVLILSLNAAYCVGMYFMLRRACEQARRTALRRLRDTAARMSKAEDDRRRRVEMAIAQIEKERTGAFAGFLQQPAVGAMLLPLSLLGAWAILQYIAAIY
jgi:hypothetical protein